ncbi:hypothetical protein MFIFM68171_05631 [Madurella fahalii]|uniref:Uncharacterized protein n=1 Tax=Madurella fahalii TaxID=1157608 RepID=A0ABQ0GCC7_9PEZI
MKVTRTPIIHAALRPSLRQSRQPAKTRLASTGQQDSVGDKGTAKVYNKDGTNPNKNLVYLGLGALGLGGTYAMFMARPEKVASKAGEKDPEGVARQRAANSPPAR